MAITLEELRDKVRIELRDPNGRTFQDADVNYAVNQAYAKVFTMVAKALQNQFVTVNTFDVVGGQRAYALEEDFLRTKLLEFVDGNQTVPLKRYVRGASTNFTGGSTYNLFNDYPTYDYEGDYLVFEPTPLSDLEDGFRHTYYAKSTELVDDDDEVHDDFNKQNWIDLTVVEAAWVCFSQVEAMGGRVSNDFKDRLKELRESVEDSLVLRSLSPMRNRRKGYFQ